MKRRAAHSCFSRPHAATRVAVSDAEFETAGADAAIFDTIWQAVVWDRWPCGSMSRLAPLLVELRQPNALTVDLDRHAVRRLLLGAHLRPAGRQRLLARLAGPSDGVDPSWRRRPLGHLQPRSPTDEQLKRRAREARAGPESMRFPSLVDARRACGESNYEGAATPGSTRTQYQGVPR